ncbi:MAG: aminotransferase class I/II-fold pyridoxal phosphate-dependent enzyme, partial [Pseudomonadota bacterium]
MSQAILHRLDQSLEGLRTEGLFKTERIIDSPQQSAIRIQSDSDGREVLNFCANNYLGLANHPHVIAAAHRALDEYGYGLASVRFICGTQTIHKELEARISRFLGTEDCILYPSCFDANGGLFETILGPDDAVISDALNHASIIDGIRLCKAQRYRYAHDDMASLEQALSEAAGAQTRLIVTDGVFSMDGTIAQLDKIVAQKAGAVTVVDHDQRVVRFGQGD